MHEFKMQPSELDNLEFLRFHSLVEYIAEMDKKASESEGENKVESDPKYNYQKQLKDAQKSYKMPKIPKMPKIK